MNAMFKAVVWKELRENLKWAVIVMLGMATAFALAIPSLEDVLVAQGFNLVQIANAFESITTIGGLLAGLAIGVAQTVVENRGDKWGFLAHRPIERTRLFWGKATAGILLYASSTGLPVAAALIWVAAPGYAPLPFDWRLALPAIANLLCGLVFYFAGFLTGMRDARWYVSRALGVGAALCCLFLQVSAATAFWQAIAMSAAGLVILGAAAWGTFVTGGRYGPQPGIGRIATGLSIGIGITLVGFLVAAMNLSRFGVAVPPDVSRITTHSVTADGVFVKVTREKSAIVEISDPDGRPLERYRSSIGGKLSSAGLVGATLVQGTRAPPSFRSIAGMYTQVQPASAPGHFSWFYVHHLGLLAAFDSETGRVAGWLGTDGFSSGNAKPRPFTGRLKDARSNYGDGRLLVFDDAVYRMDPEKRTVEKAFQRDAAEVILGAAASRTNESTPVNFKGMADFEVISTSRRVIVQRPDGTRLVEAPQPGKAQDSGYLQVKRAMLAPGAPIFLRYSSSALPGNESLVSEFNSAGVMVNSWTLPAANNWLPTPWPRVAFLSAVTPPIAQVSLEIARQPLLLTPLSRSLATTRWIVTILSALLSAAAVFLQGRRYAFPYGRLGTWIAISLVLGPLGYLLLLALVEWPARESCPACSKKRVVTREHCEHCGKPFATPTQDGTEIFEPASR